MSHQDPALTGIDASLPTWASKLTPGCPWLPWEGARYGILYFLLHLDGLIDL